MSPDDGQSARNLTEALNRLDTTISNSFSRGGQVQNPAGDLSAALGATAARVGGAAGGVAMPMAPAVGAAATSAAVAAPKAIDVRVVNDRSMALPVTIIDPPAKEDRTSVVGSIVNTVAGGLGSFIGGIFGALASPIAAIVGATELVIALGQALVLMTRVHTLLDRLKSLGIIPISSVIETVLGGVDKALARLLPLVDWAVVVVERVVDWISSSIAAASAWVGNVVNSLSGFLAKYLTYLVDAVLRPSIDLMIKDIVRSIIDTVAGLIFSGIFATANVLREVFDWAWATLARVMTQTFNVLLGIVAILTTAINTMLPKGLALPVPTAAPVPAAPADLDLTSATRAGVATGRQFGSNLAELLLGPAPKRPAAQGALGKGNLRDTAAGEVAEAERSGAAPERPTFVMPGLLLPALSLPATPKSKEVEKILGTGTPAALQPAPAPAPPPLTLNGGITVQISAERVDSANAEQTARTIAEHVLAEIGRLSDNDRFRRGLPTAAVA